MEYRPLTPPEGETFVLSTGDALRFPIYFADASAIMAAFTVSAARTRELLPAGLCPVRVLPGTAVLVFAGLHYPRCFLADGTPTEPYNEAAVVIPALAGASLDLPLLPFLLRCCFKNLGEYIHRLPVTTALARAAGVEIMGAPKFLAEITFEENAEGRTCRVRADGRDVWALQVARLPARSRRWSETNYTMRNGQIVRWRFDVRGDLGVDYFGGAHWELGDHPLAEELRRLKMGKMALVRAYAPRFRARLQPPDRGWKGVGSTVRSVVTAPS